MFSPDPDLDMISGRRCTHNVPDGPFPPPPALQIPSFCHNTSLGSDDSSPALKVVPAVESLEDCYKSCAQAASISCAYFSYDPSIKDCQLLRRTNKSIAAEVTVSMMCALNTTTTTIPPLPFIADPACYMELTNMVHADAGVVRNVPNVEECLRSCWWDPHCVAFGYLKEPKDCWMRYAIVATTTLDGLVSGVLSCFAKAALLSQAPPVPLPTHSDPGNPSLLRCLKYNVSLMPPPHSEWTFYTNTKKTTADDVEGCIRNCVEDRGAFCSLVNFDTSTSQCTLLRAAGGQKYDPNTVSVDLGCLYPKHYQPWRYAGSTRHFDPTDIVHSPRCDLPKKREKSFAYAQFLHVDRRQNCVDACRNDSTAGCVAGSYHPKDRRCNLHLPGPGVENDADQAAMFRLSCDRSRDYIFGRKNVYLRVAWDDDPTWCSSNCGKRYITATDKLGVSAAPDTTFNLIPVRDGVKIQVNACGAANGPTQYRDGDPIDPVCLLEQHEFDGYDVHVGWNITSLEACARACLPYVGCEFVTWVPSRNECHFKSSDENARFNSTFSSVRMSCLSDPTAVADLELDVKPECYQEGDIMGNDILSVKNVESAEYCVKRGYLYKDYGCKAVTYKTDEKICYLKAISNNPHPNSGAISLPLDCITDATIKTKYCKPGTYVSSTGTLGKEADAAIFAQIDAGLLTYFREASTGLYFFFSNTPDDPSILKGSSGPTKMFEIL